MKAIVSLYLVRREEENLVQVFRGGESLLFLMIPMKSQLQESWGILWKSMHFKDMTWWLSSPVKQSITTSRIQLPLLSPLISIVSQTFLHLFFVILYVVVTYYLLLSGNDLCSFSWWHSWCKDTSCNFVCFPGCFFFFFFFFSWLTWWVCKMQIIMGFIITFLTSVTLICSLIWNMRQE